MSLKLFALVLLVCGALFVQGQEQRWCAKMLLRQIKQLCTNDDGITCYGGFNKRAFHGFGGRFKRLSGGVAAECCSSKCSAKDVKKTYCSSDC